jgi:hypothetical protein
VLVSTKSGNNDITARFEFLRNDKLGNNFANAPALEADLRQNQFATVGGPIIQPPSASSAARDPHQPR